MVPRAATHAQQRRRRKKPRKRRPDRSQRKKDELINQLILQALSARKQRGGLSLASLREAVLANGYDVSKNKTCLRMAVRRLVRNGSLVETKGRGAATAGYLKLSKRQRPEKPQQTRRRKTTATTATVPKPRAGGKAKKETNKRKCPTKNPPKKRTALKASHRKTKPKPKKTRK